MRSAFRHIASLSFKELVGLFRDPLLMGLIVYNFSAGIYLGASAAPDSIDHAAIAVVDEDNSPLTQRITDAFIPPLFAKPEMISRMDIDRMLDMGKFTFVVVFPSNFQERVLANHRPEIQVNIDATRMSQAFTGNGYIQSIITREVNKFLRENRPGAKSAAAEALVRNRFNANLTQSWAGAVNELVNNIALIAMLLTGAALIRERERGTLEHLLVTPIHPVEIMLAKIIAMSLVVLAATGLSLVLMIQGALNIPIAGSKCLFMTGVLLNLFAMTSMGILLACFSRDMPQLGILMILVLMPMQILSGGSTPLSSMPVPIQLVMHFAPTTYFVKFSNAILIRGAEFPLIWEIFLQTFLLGCLYFFVSLLRFRKSVAS